MYNVIIQFDFRSEKYFSFPMCGSHVILFALHNP